MIGRAAEVRGEPLRVDGGRGDDDLEVGPAGQQLLEVAEEEVDVEAALVGLVDDDRVVAAQHPVALDLGEQDAVGHHLDQRCRSLDAVGEPDLVADRARRARCRAPRRSARRRCGRRSAAAGCGRSAPRTPAAELEADLRELGRLARARSRRRRSRPGGRGSPRRCRPCACADRQLGGNVMAGVDMAVPTIEITPVVPTRVVHSVATGIS